MNSSLACKSKLPALAGNCLIAASLALPTFNALAAAVPGDSAEGKRLYDASCTGCHDTGVFTRKTRSVQSLDALKQQLNSCGHASGKELSPAQKQDIVKYLNDQFYRFP
jgi:mono/diheme cytochrome c family protein